MMQKDLSRIGYHYFADEAHYTQRDLNAWLPILQNLKAHWLVLRGSLTHSIPENFIKNLLENSIAPIIHIPVKVGEASEREIFPLLQTYSRWGIQHVVIGDRPNMRTSWELEEWSKTGLVERYVDLQLPILRAQASAGLYPCLPALEPGGDYWDTSFLKQLLQSLHRRDEDAVLRSMRLGVYAWTFGRSLTWGSGGPLSWPDTKPYQTPIGSEDQMGMNIFEWYQAIAEECLGEPLPMVVIAGGPGPEFEGLDRGSDPIQVTVLDITRSLIGGEIPPYVENFAFYILATSRNQEISEFAWYRDPRQESAVAEAVQNYLDKSIVPSQPAHKKNHQNFYLFPKESIVDEAMLQKTYEHAILTKGILGFSIKEAQKAANVYLVGREESFSQSIRKDLAQAGCKVHYSTAIFTNPLDIREKKHGDQANDAGIQSRSS